MTIAKYTVLALAALAVAWPAGASRSQSNLLGTEWRVAEIAGTTVTDAGSLRFEAGKITGRAACNTFFGSLKETGTGIEIGGIGTTRKFCADRMALEQALLKALQDAKTARLEGATLTLTGADGKPVAKLVR